MPHVWLWISRDDLLTERLQAQQEGRDLTHLQSEFERLLAQDPPNQEEAGALLDAVQEAPLRPEYPFDEPDELEAIRNLSQGYDGQESLRWDRGELLDRLHGAWLGRCCGCFLGKVTEGWRRPTMEGFLKETGQWPLSTYLSKGESEEVRAKFGLTHARFWREDHDAMPEDDDTNYTTTGLALMQRKGRAFTPDDVADFWMSDIPILHTCTAERVAYKNLVNGIRPPASASYRNPYREWIGAQIRADFWGYANPGNPAVAAEYAWRDACISHVKNGIYGEMWAAAMVAGAFRAQSPLEAIETGLKAVPSGSRLALALRAVITAFHEEMPLKQAQDALHNRWDETRSHDWCHTISNAEIVTMALLWGGGDFGKTICLAVETCFDTDCNGATCGSVLGAMQGASALPSQWTAPLNDTLETGVQGYHRVSIREMAERSLEVALTPE